ncbi:MAG: hypothetical protein IPJ30_12720 [Acidobacteria bacterium]|nr:hypothetical protein [Acidobacteriota bacterium]
MTTPMQTFALIITAEPHFLVRRPKPGDHARIASPYTLTGVTISTTPLRLYFGNTSDYFRDAHARDRRSRLSKTP